MTEKPTTGYIMKMHGYIKLEVERSHTGKYWRYHVTACGLRRQADDFHIDGAKTSEEITCKKCMAKCRKQAGVLGICASSGVERGK